MPHTFSLNATGIEPTIYNITLTAADTQYSQVIPNGTHKFEIQARTPHYVRFAWVDNKVATPTEPYDTLKPNQIIWEEDLQLINKTLYFASSDAGVVVELTIWV